MIVATDGRPLTRSQSARPISRPGRVAGVQHAPHAVRRFAPERRPSVRVAIEARAPVDQLAHVARAFLDEHVDGRLVAQSVAGADRVRRVQRGAVVVADRRRDAALRVAGVALARIGLGEDGDAPGGRQRDGRAQSGDAAADDEKVGRSESEDQDRDRGSV